MGPWIEEVIGDQMVMVVMTNKATEIREDEKPGEEESRAPEWVRNPIVQIVVIPGGRIVSDNGRAFLIVIVIDYRGIGLRLVLSILPGTTWRNSQTEPGRYVLERLQCFIPSHRQLLSIRCSTHSVL